MSSYYFYEVDYTCTCEVCGNKFSGIMRRGPLEYPGGVIPTGMGSSINAADMKLSKNLIESAVEGSGNQPYTASNADKCPDCGARQSWYRPLKEPEKPGGASGYVKAVIIGGLIGLGIGLMFVYKFPVVTAVCAAVGIALGILIVNRSRAKHGEEKMKQYEIAKKEYDDYIESLKKRESRNKPEIQWETARRVPCD